ncbi:MAG: Holliday junction branch migration protein RuvA [Bdellovibrionaceae bacterium]|nr:Holliday junction branch migration protein RuvA [Pseudobdellovibrionaceae bacterium]
MIGFLQGSPMEFGEETLIINVRGVGYEVHCSKNTLDFVVQKDIVQLYVYTHIREDQFLLFGFHTKAEKSLFMSLIKVSGIGPKMATKILSAAKSEAIFSMIDNSDVKGLTQLPKIGKKTAEQMILSLKGKLVFADDEEKLRKFMAKNDIVSALVHLGFKLNDVQSVVAQMEPETDLHEGVRKGLVALTQQI